MRKVLNSVLAAVATVLAVVMPSEADPSLVNTNNEAGQTPLYLAVQNRQKEEVESLLRQGADVNAKNRVGWTPLHLAVQLEQREVAELLLDKGAEVNVKDSRGQTPLHLATKR